MTGDKAESMGEAGTTPGKITSLVQGRRALAGGNWEPLKSVGKEAA